MLRLRFPIPSHWQDLKKPDPGPTQSSPMNAEGKEQHKLRNYVDRNASEISKEMVKYEMYSVLQKVKDVLWLFWWENIDWDLTIDKFWTETCSDILSKTFTKLKY